MRNLRLLTYEQYSKADDVQDDGVNNEMTGENMNERRNRTAPTQKWDIEKMIMAT